MDAFFKLAAGKRSVMITVIAMLIVTGCAKRRNTGIAKAPAKPVPARNGGYDASRKQSKQARQKNNGSKSDAITAELGSTQKGVASWYGVPYHGRQAASGEVYDMEQLTAAHRTLPFQTWVEVTNLDNGKQVAVRITDRGPFIDDRIIDLSQAAAREIDMIRSGIAPVQVRVIEARSRVPSPPDPVGSAPVGDPLPATSEVESLSLSKEAESKQDQTAAGPPEDAADQGDRYAVQAGAFADRERAKSVIELLAMPDARIVPMERNTPEGSSVLWRVLIGHELSAEQAAELSRSVANITGAALVVRDR